MINYVKLNKFLLLALIVLISNNLKSQNLDYLKINSSETYSYNMFFRNNFGTYNKTILFHAQSLLSTGTKYPRMNDKYYILDSDSNRIIDLIFQDSLLVPLAFINNDTIVLRVENKNDWIFYSYSQNKYISEIPQNIKKLLNKIPKEIDKDSYGCKFEKSLNQMFLIDKTGYNSNLAIYKYNNMIDTVEKKVFNFNKFYNYSTIIDAYWISSTQILLILINRNKQEYVYCVYNTSNDNINKLNYFNRNTVLDDCLENKCLVRLSNNNSCQAAIYEIDLKTLKYKVKYQIFEKYRDYDHSYRIGFVSPSKIARMATSEMDMISFEIYLNQPENLIDIRFEKVE